MSRFLAFPSFSPVNSLNLGSGWAAHAILKVADTYKLRLIVVSPTNHFVFTPSKYKRRRSNCDGNDHSFSDFLLLLFLQTIRSAGIGFGWNCGISKHDGGCSGVQSYD